jgi:hypothetical protein
MRTYYDLSRGQRRIITKFLWFPKRIENEKRWLERASWVEQFVDWETCWKKTDKWYAICWLDHCNFYYQVQHNKPVECYNSDRK